MDNKIELGDMRKKTAADILAKQVAGRSEVRRKNAVGSSDNGQTADKGSPVGHYSLVDSLEVLEASPVAGTAPGAAGMPPVAVYIPEVAGNE